MTKIDDVVDPPLSNQMLTHLQAISAEMRSDGFWRDLATPLQIALTAVRDEAEAFDSISAKEYRKKAVEQLEFSVVQLGKAAENKLWVSELEVVKSALAQLKGAAAEGSVIAEQAAEVQHATTAAPTKVQATSSQSTTVAALQAKQAAEKGSAPPKHVPTTPSTPAEFEAPSPPFTWDQDEDGCVSVSIPVPHGCQKQDVSVTFQARHLAVHVQGHPLSPVVDADLLYPVETSACSWGLEGTGTKRLLAINLEKKNEEEKWTGLLDDDYGRMAKELTSISLEHGMSLQQWKPGDS